MFSNEREGGISRVFREVVPRIAEIDPNVSFLLYLRQKVRSRQLPESNSITYQHEPSLKPWKWFFHRSKVQRYFLDRAYQRAKPDIFQSTFFTRPDSICTPFVLTVHDMLDELYVGDTTTPAVRAQIKLKSHCIASADLIFSVSQCTTHDILKYHHIDPQKIVTVHHGVGKQFRVIDDESKKRALFDQTWTLSTFLPLCWLTFPKKKILWDY